MRTVAVVLVIVSSVATIAYVVHSWKQVQVGPTDVGEKPGARPL